MAVEGETRDDIQAHVKSYANFAWMMKWGTVAAAIVGFIVVLIISS